MLIAEQLMLLWIDPERGEIDASSSHADVEQLAAAALILDLAEQKRLQHRREHVSVADAMPMTHPQLTIAVNVLATPNHGLLLGAAIDLLVMRMQPICERLLESLFRRDIVHRMRRSWWPWSGLRFPLRSLQARNEAIATLNADTLRGAPPLRGLGLLVLTDMAGRLPHCLHGAEHEAAAQRLLHLAREPSPEGSDHELLVELRKTLIG